MSINNEAIYDMLFDLNDIKKQAKLHQFGELPKDNDGSGFTINDCLDDLILKLENALWPLNHSTYSSSLTLMEK